MIKSRRLKTEPWFNSTWTRKSLLKICLHNLNHTNHSCTPSFLKVNHTTSLSSQSNVFSVSTNTKYKFFLFADYFPLAVSKKGVYSSTSWCETKLHLIILHLLSYHCLDNYFNYLKNLVSKFRSPMVPSF